MRIYRKFVYLLLGLLGGILLNEFRGEYIFAPGWNQLLWSAAWMLAVFGGVWLAEALVRRNFNFMSVNMIIAPLCGIAIYFNSCCDKPLAGTLGGLALAAVGLGMIMLQVLKRCRFSEIILFIGGLFLWQYLPESGLAGSGLLLAMSWYLSGKKFQNGEKNEKIGIVTTRFLQVLAVMFLGFVVWRYYVEVLGDERWGAAGNTRNELLRRAYNRGGYLTVIDRESGSGFFSTRDGIRRADFATAAEWSKYYDKYSLLKQSGVVKPAALLLVSPFNTRYAGLGEEDYFRKVELFFPDYGINSVRRILNLDQFWQKSNTNLNEKSVSGSLRKLDQKYDIIVLDCSIPMAKRYFSMTLNLLADYLNDGGMLVLEHDLMRNYNFEYPLELGEAKLLPGGGRLWYFVKGGERKLKTGSNFGELATLFQETPDTYGVAKLLYELAGEYNEPAESLHGVKEPENQTPLSKYYWLCAGGAVYLLLRFWLGGGAKDKSYWHSLENGLTAGVVVLPVYIFTFNNPLLASLSVFAFGILYFVNYNFKVCRCWNVLLLLAGAGIILVGADKIELMLCVLMFLLGLSVAGTRGNLLCGDEIHDCGIIRNEFLGIAAATLLIVGLNYFWPELVFAPLLLAAVFKLPWLLKR